MLFTRNEDADALRIAQAARGRLRRRRAAQPGVLRRRSCGVAPGSDRPCLGLVRGRRNSCRTHRARLRAASAFWASRASRRLHDAAATARWLQVAADERLTLHGLLARRILRMDTGILPSGEVCSAQADVDAVAATPEGQRAFALLQIGQTRPGRSGIRGLWPEARTNPAFGRSLLMVAAAAGLTDCAAQMAAALQSRDGHRHDELRFPLPRLRPAGGFSIDPALVYALTRLESNFDAGGDFAGRRPRADADHAGNRAIHHRRPVLFAPNGCTSPRSNLDIGQRYISYLARPGRHRQRPDAHAGEL